MPFAYADFHRDLLSGRRVLVGCPKLDDVQAYVGKLVELLRESNPRSLTVARMEVPCCAGIAWAAREAVRLSGVAVPVSEVTVGVAGNRISLTAPGAWRRPGLESFQAQPMRLAGRFP